MVSLWITSRALYGNGNGYSDREGNDHNWDQKMEPGRKTDDCSMPLKMGKR